MKNNYFPQNYILYHNYKIIINSYALHESTTSYNNLKLKSWQNRSYELIEDVPPKNIDKAYIQAQKPPHYPLPHSSFLSHCLIQYSPFGKSTNLFSL